MVNYLLLSTNSEILLLTTSCAASKSGTKRADLKSNFHCFKSFHFESAEVCSCKFWLKIISKLFIWTNIITIIVLPQNRKWFEPRSFVLGWNFIFQDVTNNSPSQDSFHQDNQIPSKYNIILQKRSHFFSLNTFRKSGL